MSERINVVFIKNKTDNNLKVGIKFYKIKSKMFFTNKQKYWKITTQKGITNSPF